MFAVLIANGHLMPCCAGIVLCGGRSQRMGREKATLPFGDEFLLQRVVRLLGAVANPIVVVAAGLQQLPALPDEVMIARDEQPDLGPLQGIHAGVERLGDGGTLAYITSCDVPFLQAEFVRLLAARADDVDVVIPRDRQFHHPLAAIYRVAAIRPRIAKLLASGRRRPLCLLEGLRVRQIDVAELQAVDPQLDTLVNLNYPEEYARAIARIAAPLPSAVSAGER